MTASPDAELSALASSLDELVARIGSLARQVDHEPTDRAAIDLYEAERALTTAVRRIARARRQLATSRR